MKFVTNKVLFVLHRQIGDVLLATPLIQALKKAYPQSEVVWVAHRMAKAVLEGQPGLDRVWYLPVWPKPPRNWKTGFRYLGDVLKCALEELKLVWKIRRGSFDVVVDGMCNPRTCLQAALSGSPLRVGISTRWIRNLAYNRLIPRDKLKGYLGHARLLLLEPLGVQLETFLDPISPRLPLLPAHHKLASEFLIQFELKNDQFVCLSPTHRHPVRKWPPRHFLELAWRFVNELQMPVVWLWGPDEFDEVKAIHNSFVDLLKERKQRSSFSIFVEKLWSLNEVGAVCAKAYLWVGNSNGLSHIAVASGCMTVEVHGPTDPSAWTHPDTSRHRSVQRDKGCRQCEKRYCQLEKRECLEDLSVDRVWCEIESLKMNSHDINPPSVSPQSDNL